MSTESSEDELSIIEQGEAPRVSMFGKHLDFENVFHRNYENMSTEEIKKYYKELNEYFGITKRQYRGVLKGWINHRGAGENTMNYEHYAHYDGWSVGWWGSVVISRGDEKRAVNDELQKMREELLSRGVNIKRIITRKRARKRNNESISQ